MKKIVNILYFILIFVCFLHIDVYASTNTRERTEGNYLVPDYVTVTENNREAILSTPSVDSSEKVYDFANLFSDSEEQLLYNQVTDYINTYNMDLAIVTISNNNKYSAKEYSMDFYDYNSFGISDNHDGVLFLIDMDTREIYMTTTGDAINMYNDYRIDSILDSVYMYMSDSEYYQGANKFIDKLAYFANLGYPSSGDSYSRYEPRTLSNMPYIPILIFSIAATAIIIIVLVNKNKLVNKAVAAKEYLVKDSVSIQLISDTFLGRSISKVARSHDSGGSGGSSISSGSSGISHGGGGHKF